MSSFILGLLSLILFYIVIVQIAKAKDLVKALQDGQEEEASHGKRAFYLLLLGFAILAYSIISAFVYKKYLLPKPATEQGVWIQQLINITLIFTGSVFVITQALLFYFTYKYHYKKGNKAYFYPHNNTIEVVWTVIPAIVLTVLIGIGMWRWYSIFNVFKDRPRDVCEVEVIGKQFMWVLRYPGKDGVLGKRDFSLVCPDNELGINWNDPASHDDILADEMVLPKGKTVFANIGSLDVIHSFYIPEFRFMMDAVPGVPTKFWFKPTITSEEMKKIKNDPEFSYYIACNNICGNGHYNMKKKVRVVEQAEYDKWLGEQKSYYETVAKAAIASGSIILPGQGSNTNAAPAEEAPSTKTSSTAAYSNTLSTGFALSGAVANGVENKLIDFIKSGEAVSKDKWFSFDRLLFETGKSTLKPESQEQLKNVAEIMKAFPSVEIKIGGYTDNVGDPAANMKLSDDRAKNVMAELVKLGVAENRMKAEGYGEQHPVADNKTAEGRQQNRRIDIRVTKK